MHNAKYVTFARPFCKRGLPRDRDLAVSGSRRAAVVFHICCAWFGVRGAAATAPSNTYPARRERSSTSATGSIVATASAAAPSILTGAVAATVTATVTA
jgi:hypothetical protein